MTQYDLTRFAINQITTPKWAMPQAIEGYSRQGIKGIAVWRNFLEDYGVMQTAKHLRDAQMWVASLCTSAWVSETDPAAYRAKLLRTAASLIRQQRSAHPVSSWWWEVFRKVTRIWPVSEDAFMTLWPNLPLTRRHQV